MATITRSKALARRRPKLLLRLSGVLLLRFAQRRLRASLFHEPPRFTRFEPRDAHVPLCTPVDYGFLFKSLLIGDWPEQVTSQPPRVAKTQRTHSRLHRRNLVQGDVSVV